MSTHESKQPQGGTALAIEGMKCGGCVANVKRALAAVPGVADVDVDLRAKRATVQGSASTNALVAAVQAAGYRAMPAPAASPTERNDGPRSGCCG